MRSLGQIEKRVVGVGRDGVGEWRVADLAASSHTRCRLYLTRSCWTGLRALSGHAEAATPLLDNAPICRGCGWLCLWLAYPYQGVSCLFLD